MRTHGRHVREGAVCLRTRAQSGCGEVVMKVAVGRFGRVFPTPQSAEPCLFGPSPLLQSWVVDVFTASSLKFGVGRVAEPHGDQEAEVLSVIQVPEQSVRSSSHPPPISTGRISCSTGTLQEPHHRIPCLPAKPCNHVQPEPEELGPPAPSAALQCGLEHSLDDPQRDTVPGSIGAFRGTVCHVCPPSGFRGSRALRSAGHVLPGFAGELCAVD